MSQAVVGLGALGLAVARHVSAVLDEPVLGIDVSAERRHAWEACESGGSSNTIDDARACQQVFIVVPDGQAACELARRLAMSRPRPVVYVLSTLSAETAEQFDSGAPYAGNDCWPVQVTGGESGALHGRLLAIVPDDLPDACERFLLETIALQVLRAGSARNAALIKLLANALIAYQFAGLAQIMQSASTLGLDLAVLTHVIQSGSSGSPALRAVHEYPVEGLRKDLHLLADTALAPADPLQAPEGLRRIRSLLANARRPPHPRS